MSEISTSGLKARVIEAVNDRAQLAQVINDSLFSFGELGFHEYETSKYLNRDAGAARLYRAARRCRDADRLGGALGLRWPGHRHRQRHRCVAERLAEARRDDRFDAKRCDTYLEQLGVVYPTLERQS